MSCLASLKFRAPATPALSVPSISDVLIHAVTRPALWPWDKTTRLAIHANWASEWTLSGINYKFSVSEVFCCS